MAVPIFDSCSMDFTTRTQYAQRVRDGQWFKRFQYRDARDGYKWSPWAAVVTVPDTLGHPNPAMKARLPA